MQTVKEPAQIAHFVRGQRFFDLGKACICEIRKWQVLRRAHCCNADQKGKDLRHREARGSLHGLRIKLQPAATPAFRVDDKSLIAQRTDIAQDRSTGGPYFFGQLANYAERRRYGERVSTGFVESTVNAVVGKRFCKRQQMRWSKAGAHLMLQTRTRTLDGTLDGTLRKKFQQWYPGMKPDGEAKMAA